MMNSRDIRDKFLRFFEEKQHLVVPSAPIVVKNDPTLMFTNAGMNQFKDYFLGNEAAESKRVADTQRCLRVSGKHNDLEEVGHDTYHHTMFEMLGNWSFGDYFKKEAIEWAWELLTEVYELDEDRMYASVFGGDELEGLERDSEALKIWSSIIPEDRILFGSKKDNFWEMGDTGPCGPCSEIHIDLRPKADREKVPGASLVNQDHPQVVEVWNLVFMEFNRQESGKLVNLPEKHIDTGMGFERLCMAVQNKESNYDTDVFQPIIQAVAKDAGVKYGEDEKMDVALRVIADHIRAVAFAIADGQLPSNTGGGYVIRRILRRGVRYGFTFLGFKQPFMNTYVALLAEQFDGVFDELKDQLSFVQKVMEEEEVSFLRTLDKGLAKLGSLQNELTRKGEHLISGTVAFELYDTYGFPLDLTRLIGKEYGLHLDEKGFEEEMAQQKMRSKKDAEKETGDWTIIKEGEPEFVGYEHMNTSASILRYRRMQQKGKDFFQIVLDKTPFYAESGGQVGDNGVLTSSHATIKIIDTQKENNLIVHKTPELPEVLTGTWEAQVNDKRRALIMSNHSATHLMHAALKQVLGEHVEQRGSLVNDKILRFDFSHFAKMTAEEITRVEQMVNAKIRENIALDEKRNVPIETAKEMGATALFGEKYGDFVRVITFDPEYSRELCGGTHVPATGHIGYFKILSEASSAAGIRRIEAVTAWEAEKVIEERFELVNELKEILKSKDIKQSIENLLIGKQQLEKEIEELKNKETAALKNELIQSIIEKDGVNILIQQVAVPDGNALKQLSYELRNQVDNLVSILAANVNGKPQIAVMISDSLAGGDLHAGNLVRELASLIKGGGGGQPFFATAGGKDLSGLDAVVEAAKAKFNL